MIQTAKTIAVADADLREALEDSLSRHFHKACPIRELSRRPSPYRSSFAIEEVDVELADGASIALMFKDLDWHSLSAAALAARPAFLHDPVREIAVYRSILSRRLPGTAAYYGASCDPSAGRYWLFLERVAGQELYKVGELSIWCEAARWLAKLHVRFSRIDEAGAGTSHLLRYDAAFYRKWVRRACEFARESPAASVKARESFNRLADRYDGVVDRLVAQPVTLIHGEFYASNVLIRDESQRVCPVDWEMAALGPGLIDLAALTAGVWSDEQKAAMVGAYHDTLARTVAEPPELEELAARLDYCRLHIAMQWLGWSRRWTPPADKAQDWLGEAQRIACRLGLL